MQISKAALGWGRMALFVGAIVVAAYKLAFVRLLLLNGLVIVAILIPIVLAEKIADKLSESVGWVKEYSWCLQFIVYLIVWGATIIWLLPALGLQYNEHVLDKY
jgi:uncharacterized membrane protein YGL010W